MGSGKLKMKKNFYSSWEKKLRKLLLSLTLLFGFLTSAQNIGDYGAIASGNWDSEIWGVWDGTQFAGPAQTLPTTTTQDVYIPQGRIVSTGTTNLSVNVGNLYVHGEFQIEAANFTFSSSTKFMRVYGETGGTVRWVGPANGNSLTMAPNSYIDVTGFNGDTVNVPKGTNGLQSSQCNNNAALYFGTVKYAVCGGGGNAIILFSDINSIGTLRANPKAEPMVICEGGTTYLSGTATGIFINSNYTTEIAYQWFGPNADMNSNPTPISTNQNYGNITLNTAGSYTYVFRVKETISNKKGSVVFTNDQPVTVSVNPRPAINNMSATVCSRTNFTITPQNGTNGIVPPNTQYTWSAPLVTGGMTGGAAGSGGSIVGTLVNPTNLPQTATYTVTPTSGAGCSGNSFTLTVTVNPANLTGSTNLTVGSTTPLTGTPVGGNYVSSNASVATVDPATGVVTAIAKGTAVIIYTTPAGCSVTITINVGDVCYENPTPPSAANPGKDSKFGITSLGRAGSENDNWPMVRKGAYMVLEAKTKGFVITRVESTSKILNPIEGMIVYDKSKDCLSIFNGATWNCYQTQTCP